MIRVGHHGDEHVEEDDEADGGVSAEHRHAQEFRVVMILFQAEVVQVDQAVNRPKQRLMGKGREGRERGRVKDRREGDKGGMRERSAKILKFDVWVSITERFLCSTA